MPGQKLRQRLALNAFGQVAVAGLLAAVAVAFLDGMMGTPVTNFKIHNPNS